MDRFLSFLRTPLGQFHVLLAAWWLSFHFPLPAAAAAMTLFMLRFDRFMAEDAWWRLKSVLLFGTTPIFAAVAIAPDRVWSLGNAALLGNMASTLRRPESRGEALNAVLCALLMGYAATVGWSPSPGLPGTLAFPLPWWWIGAYTVWNQAFVSLRYPHMLRHSVSMLAAPLAIASVLGSGSWLFARGTTLCLGVILGIGLSDPPEDDV